MLTTENQNKHKNVAIIGCSHSELVMDTDRAMWIVDLCKKFPRINFFNFSRAGLGNYYIDLMLKYVMYEDERHYDLVIVQMTSAHRWMFPISGNSEINLLYGNTNEMFASSRLPRQYKKYERKIKEYYGMDNLTTERMILPYAYGLMTHTKEEIETLDNIKIDPGLAEDQDKNISRWSPSIATLQSKLFARQLNKLGEQYNMLFFNWFETFLPKQQQDLISNISNLPISVTDWVSEKYPKEYKNKDNTDYIGPWNDGTHHFNAQGNKVFFDEYIMTSKIKTRLQELENA